jgi:hypothetical protein
MNNVAEFCTRKTISDVAINFEVEKINTTVDMQYSTDDGSN